MAEEDSGSAENFQRFAAKEDAEECSVCVAVNVRPLIDQETVEGCRECVCVPPEQPQVIVSSQSFTFDHVYGGQGQNAALLYDQCVLPLVEGLFKGYNATVFAYGQTGSGKTFTMGSAFSANDNSQGVIPSVMDTVFKRIKENNGTVHTVRVGFVEIHQEQIRDLLLGDGSAPQVPIHVRELPGGGICLAGATEKQVNSKSEMVSILKHGTLMRATASTEMNKRSSRSHAIFTITLEQRRQLPARDFKPETNGEQDEEDSEDEEGIDDYLCAKMHLVDLAGSERAKRTKAEGLRLKEGININKGLLALGNVICALSENKQHVPYRDSKLTRMLQDSLGGNSRTVMIACVSPADVNLEETVNTLRYANRARNIRNKPVVNRDPVAAEIAHLRQQLAATRAEVDSLRKRLGSGGSPVRNLFMSANESSDMFNDLLEETQLRKEELEFENARLRAELESMKSEVAECTQHMLSAQAERDTLALKLQRLNAHASAERDADPSTAADITVPAEELDVMKKQRERIAELEKEVRRLKQVQRISGSLAVSARRASLALRPSGLGSPFPAALNGSAELGAAPVAPAIHELGDEELAIEEHAYRVHQEHVQKQLNTLQRMLENKESQMQKLLSSGGEVSMLKQRYDKVLRDLENERDALQKERKELLLKLQNAQHMGEDNKQAREKLYKEKLKDMDQKLKDLQRKERSYAQIDKLKSKSEDTCRRLEFEIMHIKQQKVALLRQMEKANKDFQDWKKTREKEVLQLRAQGRKNAAQIQRLEALQYKQQAVLRRKTEEAEAARRRLKEVQDMRDSIRKSAYPSVRPSTAGPAGIECQPNSSAPLLRDEKSRREWIERELDMCCQSYDLQRVLEGEKAQRSDIARRLKEVEKMLANVRTPNISFSSPLVSSMPEEQLEEQKKELEEQISRHSQQIVEIQQQLVKAKADEESKGGGAADARRWNNLRTIVEARSMLRTLFRCASTLKAQAYEGQVEQTEMREEADLLRLKLDIAEQELEAAKTLAATATAAAAYANTNAPSAEPSPRGHGSNARDETDVLVESLIEEIKEVPRRFSLGKAGPTSSNVSDATCATATAAVSNDTPHQSVSHSEEEELEEDVVTDDEEDEGEEDEGDVWDPSLATPVVPKRRTAKRSSKGPKSSSPARPPRTTSRGSEADDLEAPVLQDINEARRKEGLDEMRKLTKQLLKQHLTGKRVRGEVWKAGKKNREEMIRDYRVYLEHKQAPKERQLDAVIAAVKSDLSRTSSSDTSFWRTSSSCIPDPPECSTDTTPDLQYRLNDPHTAQPGGGLPPTPEGPPRQAGASSAPAAMATPLPTHLTARTGGPPRCEASGTSTPSQRLSPRDCELTLLGSAAILTNADTPQTVQTKKYLQEASAARTRVEALRARFNSTTPL